NSITLGGTVTTQNFDLTTQSPVLTLNTGVTAGSSALTFITDSIDLQAGTSLSGTGVLSIIPLTESTSLALGDNVTGTLSLTTAELSTIQNGFSQLIFGIATGTGNVYLGSNLNFLDPATIAGGNILFSPNDPLTWTPTSPGFGTILGLGELVNYENIFLIAGGTGLDRLVTASSTDDILVPDGEKAITIGGVSYVGIDVVDALDGIDTLTTPAGDQVFSLNGVDGTINLSGILFINIEVVEGATGSHTLQGSTGADTFNLASADAFTINGITFSGIATIDGNAGDDIIQGSVGDDTFTLTGATSGSGLGIDFLNIETVQGLDGNDQFVLTSPDAFPTLEGGSGSNTLIADDQSNTFTLEGINAGNIAERGNWLEIDTIIAGTGEDTFQLADNAQITGAIVGGEGIDQLIGNNTDSGFVVIENNAGIIADKVGDWSKIENLVGGAANDTFTLQGGTLSGFIDGGAGEDVFVADNVVNQFTLTSANGGTVTGVDCGFSNIENLIGSDQADTFTLQGGTLSGSIDGLAGEDLLIADNLINQFTITSDNGGMVTGVGGTFANIENLTGNAQADTFTLQGGTLSGAIDGVAGNDFLVGDNVPNQFTIASINSGTATGIGSGFANIENLTGNAQTDIFSFSDTGILSGTIDASTGNDLLVGS
ncbi:MAG: beta strand repeat-containing protein, partial [Prochlorotrichaceae cyanobacterium]